MITSKLNQVKQNDVAEYPKLMMSGRNPNGERVIILATSFSGRLYEGFAVWSERKYHPVGFHRADWAMQAFTDYHGEIILTSDYSSYTGELDK